MENFFQFWKMRTFLVKVINLSIYNMGTRKMLISYVKLDCSFQYSVYAYSVYALYTSGA